MFHLQLIVAFKATNISDLISPVLSAMAFILSSAAFIFTVFFQLKERKRNIRQTLSSVLSEIARINVETSLLKKDEKESTPENAVVQKKYNSQLGALASGADYLIKQNEKLVTDADCELMAITYDDLGSIQQAEEYWIQSVKLAPNATQLHLHQRDYASFLMNNNQMKKGRDFFEKSLAVTMTNTDDDLRYIADTYLIWANLEKNFDNKAEFTRLIEEANAHCSKIKHKEKKVEMARLISKFVHLPV